MGWGLAARGLALAALAGTIGSVTGLSRANAQIAVASTVAVPATSGLSQRQQADLGGPAGPRPGVYRLRNLHSGHCLVFYPLASANNHASKVPVPILGHLLFIGLSMPFVPPEKAHFKQGQCQLSESDPRMASLSSQDRASYAQNYAKLTEYWVLPHPQGGVTIRSQQSVGQDERDPAPGQIPNCATVARNVWVGAPRVDFLACDIEPGRSEWRFAGSADQRFTPVVRNGGNITFAFSANDKTDCWALRGGSRDRGTDVLMWECTGGADQVYALEFVRPVEPGTEAALLDTGTWYRTPIGHFWTRGAGGVGLQGTPYEQFETVADNGTYCARRCAELDRCKAWTWTAAGYVVGSNDPPKCMWFDARPAAVNHGEAQFSRLRSGYVR